MFLPAGEFRVPVVFANEQQGQLPERREIQCFVKDAGARRAVTEEHDTDGGVAFGRGCSLGGPGRAGGQGQVASYNTGCAEHAVGCINEMHRATSATAEPGVAADDLRKHGSHVAAFRESVPVASMAREQYVRAGEMLTNPDCHGFLAGRQVRKTGNFTQGRQPLDLAFEQADAPKCPVHLLPIVYSICISCCHVTPPMQPVTVGQSNTTTPGASYQVLLV